MRASPLEFALRRSGMGQALASLELQYHLDGGVPKS